mgnify:CR=1 FL=1
MKKMRQTLALLLAGALTVGSFAGWRRDSWNRDSRHRGSRHGCIRQRHTARYRK